MNKKVNIKTIAIIVLIGMIIALISIIFNIKNKNIEKQISTKEQLTETTNDNAYVSMETHLSELNSQVENIGSHLKTQSKTTSIQLNGVGYVTFTVTFSFDHKVVGIVPANECIGVKSISGNKVTFQYNSTYASNTNKTSVTVKAIGY